MATDPARGATAAFDELTTPVAIDAAAGAYRLDVPTGWEQGRGAFGGLVLAAMARAGDAAVADDARTLRTLTGELVGPVQPGAADLVVETLRAGSGVTTVAIRLRQGGELQAHAVATYGKRRGAVDLAPTLPPPALTPWREVPVLPMGPPMAPVFTQHVEMRALGPPPFSGSPEAVATGWVRPRRPGARRDPAYVIAMADAWWPAFLVAERAPRPAATLAFALSIVDACDGLDPDAPLAYRGRLIGARDGYVVELREVWGEDGRLLALNQQTFVAIR